MISKKKTDVLGVKEVKNRVDSTKNQRSREFFLPTCSNREKKASFRWTYLGWNPGENCMFTSVEIRAVFLFFCCCFEKWRCLWIHWTDVFSVDFFVVHLNRLWIFFHRLLRCFRSCGKRGRSFWWSTVEGGMKALPAEFHNFAHDLCGGLHLGFVFLQIFRINKRSDLWNFSSETPLANWCSNRT